MYTDNPIADFAEHDFQQQKVLEQLPICSECGETIQDTQCYEINGEYICDDCMCTNHRKWVDDIDR